MLHHWIRAMPNRPLNRQSYLKGVNSGHPWDTPKVYSISTKYRGCKPYTDSPYSSPDNRKEVFRYTSKFSKLTQCKRFKLKLNSKAFEATQLFHEYKDNAYVCSMTCFRSIEVVTSSQSSFKYYHFFCFTLSKLHCGNHVDVKMTFVCFC